MLATVNKFKKSLLQKSKYVKLLFTMVNKSQIFKNLRLLGLDQQQSLLYLDLLEKGARSPLELSRDTNLNHTSVYRYLEDLQRLGLAEELPADHRTRFQARSPEDLEYLISKKEADLEKVKTVLPDLMTSLKLITQSSSSPTEVVYFRGKAGLQQLLWNTLKAAGKDEVVGFGYLNWNEHIGSFFAEKLRQECIDRKIAAREILNTFQDWKEYTNNKIYATKFYRHRFLPYSQFPITHDTYIYNDVFAMLHSFKGEVFGLEIHNGEIARTQKQIFNFLWSHAKEPKDYKKV